MTLRTLALVLAGTTVALLACPKAQAWGACHAGYTHVGPGGVYHCGATAFHGPYGGYGGVHYGGVAYGGVHYGGVAYGGAYPYYGGYTACASGGFYAGPVGVAGGVYRAGVYRRW